MATISSISFFRNEAPSPQGFALTSLIPIGKKIIDVLRKPSLPATPFVPTTIVSSIPAIAKAGGSVYAKLLQLGFPEWQVALLTTNPFTIARTFLDQWKVPANIRMLAEPLLAKRGAGGRRRRMNPLNLRALTRADRRLTQFATIARRYVTPAAPQRQVRAFKRRKK